MRKTILIIIIIFASQLLFSVDKAWISNTDKLDKLKLEQEINTLLSELKKDKENPETLAKLGISYQFICLKYYEKVSQVSINYLSNSLAIKNDAVIKAFLGVSYTLKGRDKNSLGAVKKGLELLDEAYNEDSNNSSILLMRVGTGVDIPKFMMKERINKIFSDIKKMKNFYNDGKISDNNYAKILVHEIKAYKELGETKNAMKVFNELNTKYSNSIYCENINFG